MDFLSSVRNYVSELFHCYFNSDEASCAALQSATQTDNFKQVELREIQFHELIETSRQVPVGCYIQMHRVPNYEALRRQKP